LRSFSHRRFSFAALAPFRQMCGYCAGSPKKHSIASSHKPSLGITTACTLLILQTTLTYLNVSPYYQ
jgi:hypothetical protein